MVAFAAPVLAQPQPNFSMRRDARLWSGTWPADFNRDGRTDLIAGGRRSDGSVAADPPNLLVLIGRGDGTFNAPTTLSIPARPLGTGHFNGDSYIDVVLYRHGELSVLPGNGNGTFGVRRVVSTSVRTGLPFAIVADFNADGRRDLIVNTDELPGGDTGLLLFPGNGDFTFAPPVQLPTSYSPVSSGISGDFNKDGRRDFAITLVCCSVYVFLNRGGLLFEMREIVMSQDLADLTTADLNRDGNADLLVAATFPYDPQYSRPGLVNVLRGNGDGTFRTRVTYDTGVRGEGTIVAGDFNRDGLVDVATGNWSVHHDDDMGDQLWDSISIMRGDGTGRLLRGATYALGRVNKGDANYMTTHNMLNTSDLNGDGRTDLIGSPGAIMLNRAAAPNRAPTASAGPDIAITLLDDADFSLLGSGSDPDGHWLTYTWTDQTGAVIGVAPYIHYSQPRGTTRTYTLTVRDGLGGTARDSVTVTSEAPPE